MNIYIFKPLKLYRRQLQVLQPSKGGLRRKYGGTLSLGIVRGTVVRYRERYVYVGGNSKERISIHNLETGKRISQNIKVKEIEEMYRIKWVTQFLPSISAGVSLRGNR